MKNTYWMLVVFVCTAGSIGCNPPPSPPPPVSRPAGDPSPIRTDTTIRDGDVDVEVGRPHEKPAVDVEVKPGGKVDVDVDGEKIRDRIEERREERRQTNP